MNNAERSVRAEAAFRARLTELGATLLESAWLGAMQPHRVRCAAGHECAPRPNSVQQGGGVCRICADETSARGRSFKAEAAFRALVDEQGGTVLGEYRKGRAPVLVRCAAGHDCRPTPNVVRQGGGICRVCSGCCPVTAETIFRASLTGIGAELLEFTAWRGNKYPYKIRCSNGHQSTARPNDVQQGRGVCRICAFKTWDVFYVVTSLDGTRFKIGITTGDPRPRIGDHKRAGYASVIRLVTGLPVLLAAETEGACLAALRLADLRPTRGREYFDGSALALVLDIADSYLSERKASLCA